MSLQGYRCLIQCLVTMLCTSLRFQLDSNLLYKWVVLIAYFYLPYAFIYICLMQNLWTELSICEVMSSRVIYGYLWRANDFFGFHPLLLANCNTADKWCHLLCGLSMGCQDPIGQYIWKVSNFLISGCRSIHQFASQSSISDSANAEAF